MKLFLRLAGIWLLLGGAQVAWSQPVGPKVDRVDIKYVGPASVSEQFIRGNIRLKAGDVYRANLTEADVHTLYGTGQFYNIRVSMDPADDGGVVVSYIVQARLRVTDIKISGNKQVSDSKIRKKITVKAGEPLDDQKLFTDVQEIKKLYEKYGYPDTQVKYVFDTFDETAGRASVTFQIVESQKIKITRVEFVGASAFSQKLLRKQIKTRAHWTFSWITGSGVFKADQFEDDQDALTQFYRNHGYLDFEITKTNFMRLKPNTMAVQFYVYEGKQYKVGSISFKDTTLLDTNAVRPDYKPGPEPKQEPEHSDWLRRRDLNWNFTMKTGSVFTPDGLDKDQLALEDYYGSQGHIEVQRGTTLRAVRIPNVDTGTMDLEFQIDEGQQAHVEQINIRGNIKTKDKVIRRELAIAPGEVFDMVRVKISKQRLEGLDYFDKVELQPEPTDPPIAGRKNLDVDVQEKDTGKFTLGAGINSDSGLVGFAEIDQGNFDLFHPPYFTGGGQKFRLFVQLGTEEQDYELSFVEPWFLNRKLALGVDLYRHQLDFESPNNIFDETRTGAHVSLTRALGSDFLIGSVSYTIEDVGITLNDGWHDTQPELGMPPSVPPALPGLSPQQPSPYLSNVPGAILSQVGDHLFHRFGATLAYDTRNSNKLPNHGQRTELDPEFDIGDTTYYKIEAKTVWFFPGFFRGHVLEADGRVGVAGSLSSGDVPFYDRYYLGGLYSLRGFKFRNIGPRDPSFVNGSNPDMPNEPIGGDSYWFGSLNYSIPILEKDNGPSIRFEMFLDAGAVGAGPYSFSGNFDDDYGAGLLLDIPHLGPLRLEYGIPITHDQFNGSSGQFQFGVGYTREF